MASLAGATLWAFRFGLIFTFCLYTSEFPGLKNDTYVPKFIIAALFILTFTPTHHYKTAKTVIASFIRNTAMALFLPSIAFAAAMCSDYYRRNCPQD